MIKEELGTKINQLNNWINESESIVFFGGAGVSTESGIPDFRSVDGLYNEKYKYPPEVILSHTFYKKNPEEFFRFYKDKMLYLTAKPNKAHEKLAELESKGKCKAVITQNIDGLHTQAGSNCVLELHGSVLRNHCTKCGEFYDVEKIVNAQDIPRCTCGGIIKPDVVLYEEGLDSCVLEQSIKAISNGDMLIVGGTSLSVYPAASLINYYHGNKLVFINRTATLKDEEADLVITGDIGDIFARLD